MKLTLSLALTFATLTAPALATAADRNAGPLWNQGDATKKCPKVCAPPSRWNGQWRTTVPGKMSVCGCDDPPPPAPVQQVQSVDREAGPLWNQGDAQNKCPQVCAPPSSWTGQWRTTVPGKMSVCGCTAVAAPAAPPPQQSADVEAGPLWNQGDAQNKCPQVCTPPWSWSGQWRTTVPGKMSVCGCVVGAAPAAPPPPPAQQSADVEAGPIWNQGDAQTKCPQVCTPPWSWSGQWHTTVPGTMSVCSCVTGAAPAPALNDGCANAKQACSCGNTGRPGTCGTGPHKAGLYCRCD